MPTTLKLKQLSQFVRGDTPLFVFDATVDGEAFDVTDYTGYFTLTANSAPSSNTDAVVAHVEMTKNETDNTFSYQLTHTISATLVPGTTYYFDVEVQKDPTDTNTFTISRGTFTVAQDFGI